MIKIKPYPVHITNKNGTFMCLEFSGLFKNKKDRNKKYIKVVDFVKVIKTRKEVK